MAADPDDLDRGDTLACGDLLGRFALVEPIGEGGMGQVWLARDPDLNRKVAVKVLRPEVATGELRGREARARLVREAQAMAALAHPNVIAVHEVGDHDERVFLVMELVTGGTLAQWCAATPRTVPEILDVLIQAARGLAAAHAAGLVHRDLKPANILVGVDGRARVTDFGLVGVGEATERTGPTRPIADAAPLTVTGALMGTPAYMSPEQLRGELATARSDQFSYCVTLYEALYGTRPFGGDRLHELVANVCAGRMKPVPRQPQVPPRVRAAITRGLAPAPADRFASMTALIAELEAPPPSSRRVLYAGGAALAMIAIGATALVVGGDGDDRVGAPPAPPPVRAAVEPAPVQLTDAGGCASDPVFLDDDTVAFAHSDSGGYRLSTVPRRGGPVQALTAADAIYTAPNEVPRDGELLAVRWTVDNHASLDLIRADRTAVPLPTPEWFSTERGLALRGDALYYLRRDRTQIRRLRAGVDEDVIDLPAEYIATHLSVSPDGRWLVISTARAVGVCLVDLQMSPVSLRCQAIADLAAPAVASDDSRGFDVPTSTGIWHHRFEAAGAEQLRAGPIAADSIAIAPDRRSAVYSTCIQHVQLTAIDGELPAGIPATGSNDVTARPTGEVAMVRYTTGGASVLTVRATDGTLRDLTPHDPVTIREPSWNHDGTLLVYRQIGADAGIYVVDLLPSAPERISANPADLRPLFLDDGRVVVNRYVDGGASRLYIIDRATGQSAQANPRARWAHDVDPVSGKVLVGDQSDGALWLWDPRTGVETPIDIGRVRDIEQATMTLDGRAVLAANLGELWRIPIAPPGPPVVLHTAGGLITELERPFELPGGLAVSTGYYFAGELFRVDLAKR